MMKAVLTGDIIQSEGLSQQERSVMLEVLARTIEDMEETGSFGILPFSVFRGDSFQVTSGRVDNAVRMTLCIKAALRSINNENRPDAGSLLDVRVALGIGEVEYPSDEISEADGTAYRLSGHALDAMKAKHQTLIVTTGDEEWDPILEMNCQLLEYYFDRWSSASAETVYHLLLRQTEQVTADRLRISQAAVNQRKKVAGWKGIEAFVNYWDNQLKLYN